MISLTVRTCSAKSGIVGTTKARPSVKVVTRAPLFAARSKSRRRSRATVSKDGLRRQMSLAPGGDVDEVGPEIERPLQLVVQGVPRGRAVAGQVHVDEVGVHAVQGGRDAGRPGAGLVAGARVAGPGRQAVADHDEPPPRRVGQQLRGAEVVRQ